MRSLQKKLAIAVIIGIVIGLIGLLGVLSGYAWLIASLGPTAALQGTLPTARMSRPWNVVVGHLIALAVGFAAVYATGAAHTPPFSDLHVLSLLRVAAAAMAITLTIALEFVFQANHASAGATTLLVALGFIPADWKGAVTILCAIGLITVFGEALRQLALHWRTVA
jgi:CBS-domain-containing membrane protein